MDAHIKAKPKVDLISKEIPHLLLPGEVGAVLELIVKDKDGRVTEQRIIRSKSFVRQFLQLLWVKCQLLDGSSAPSIVVSTFGDVSSVRNSSYLLAANATVNDDDYGIIVGSGNTPPALSDYALETKIDHGTGAGQLQYSAVTFGAPTSDASTSQFTITRDFANASGGDVVVRELGLAVLAYITTYAETHHLVIRDAITPLTIPNGQTLTVNYRIQTTV